MSTVALADAVPTFGASQEGPLVFIGGYTDKGSKSQGIYAYRLSTKTGELTALGLAAATPNPSFLAISPNRTLLYAANEIDNYNGAKDGSVAAFSVDRATGKLTLLNTVSSGGAGPCNLNLDESGKCLLVANYDGGSAATFRLLADGKISGAVEDIHYTGHGPNADRQATPHAHCATGTPDRGHVLMNDLGLDCIHVYKFDPATAKLTPSVPPAYAAMPGSGPRSLVFHPNGRIAYSTNELSNSVDVLTWNAAAGKLIRVQNVPTAVHPSDSRNTAASVLVDGEGKDLYVSNRGPESSIAHFAISPLDGQLTFKERVDSGGKTPRHFALDPSGKWMVVANQDGNNLAVFKREASFRRRDSSHDSIGGQLVFTGRTYPIDFPTCVLFV